MSETSSGAGMSPDADAGGHRRVVVDRHHRVAVRAARLLRRGARPETVTRVYDALDLMRGIEVFLNAVPGASLVAMRQRSAVSGRHLGPDHRDHRAARQLEQPVPHPEHRDHLRHDVPRPQGVGPDGDRGAAGVAVRGRRLLVPLRRRHGHRRARPGRRRQVPVPAARATTATSPTRATSSTAARRSRTGWCCGRSVASRR